MTTIDLEEEQLRLEEQSKSSGTARFYAALKRSQDDGNEHGTYYGSKIMRRVIEPLRDAIESELAGLRAGKAGNRSKFLKLIGSFPADVAAFVTAQNVVRVLTGGPHLTACARSIAIGIQNEMMLAAFEEEHPGLYAHLLRKYASNSQDHRLTVLRRSYLAHAEDPAIRWSQTDAVHLGVKLIHLLIESTGIIELAYFNKGTITAGPGAKAGAAKTMIQLRPTEKLMAWIEETEDVAALCRPVCLPMVVRPRPWTTAYDGGYITFPPKTVGLVRGVSPRTLQEFNNSRDQMPQVYEAVNIAQDVAWRVNERVLAVAERLWETKQEVAGLSAGEPLMVPPSPFAGRDREELSDEEREQLRVWKMKARDIHESNAKMTGRRIGCGQSLAVAQQFHKYPAIWFPHNFDFRGRLYAVPTGLSPQGSDLSKGLLHFAGGKPIGDGTGPGWLAVHGANTWGNDKITFEDRIDWVEANEARILSCAGDPLGDLWWTEADSPFCFLAFCFEWEGFCREGAAHRTFLPVALDGSCSGLQHYSAALLDPVGGAAVNLTPRDTPADVYAEVAARAVLLLTVRASAGGEDAELAKALITFGIDRKATKRPTMTLPYGSTRMSCGDYIQEWLMAKAGQRAPEDNPIRDLEAKASNLLAAVVWDAIGDVVQSARVAMAWLRSLATAASRDEMPLTWTTPDGFRVTQAYADTSDRRVKTRAGDRLIYITLREYGDKLDKRRQASGFPPNWVHSMDGTHLRETAVMAAANGIPSLALIHDSFGTLACDCDTLSAVLREALIGLYSEDRLGELRSEVCSYLSTSAKVPPSPVRGSLDLQQVRSAQFTFA